MGYREDMARCRNYIAEHLQEELTPAKLAERFGYSFYHFCHVFRSVNGMAVGFHNRLTVFEMIFYAAKLEIDMLLQFFGKGRQGLILQAVQNMPPQICIGQIFPCGYKIRLY